MREEIATKSDCCFANVTTDGENRICTNCSFPCYFITEEVQEAIESLIREKQKEARVEELEKAINKFEWSQGTDYLDKRLSELKEEK